MKRKRDGSTLSPLTEIKGVNSLSHLAQDEEISPDQVRDLAASRFLLSDRPLVPQGYLLGDEKLSHSLLKGADYTQCWLCTFRCKLVPPPVPQLQRGILGGFRR
ncbi:hypothetical protein TNCV_4686091 [Trichonephila clavipes]|nr:hypothetical protein TNCV_4686091 [Trichonephila clavipes]